MEIKHRGRIRQTRIKIPFKHFHFLLRKRKLTESPQFVHGETGDQRAVPAFRIPSGSKQKTAQTRRTCPIPSRSRKHPRRQIEQRTAHSFRNPVQHPQFPHHQIAFISAEEFIRSIPAERHRHALPRKAAQQIGRQNRRISVRLPAAGKQKLQRCEIFRLDRSAMKFHRTLRMRSNPLGVPFRLTALVVCRIRKRDAETPQGVGRLQTRCNRCQNRGIHPSGKKHPQRNIGCKTRPNRLRHHLPDLLRTGSKIRVRKLYCIFPKEHLLR